MKFLMDKQHFLTSNHIIFPSLCSLMLIVSCCGAAVSKSRKEKLLIPKTSIRFLSMPWIQISLWSSVPVSQSEVEEFVPCVCEQWEYLWVPVAPHLSAVWKYITRWKTCSHAESSFDNTAVNFWHTRKQMRTFQSLVHWGDAFPFQFWIWRDLIKAGSACSEVKPFLHQPLSSYLFPLCLWCKTDCETVIGNC